MEHDVVRAAQTTPWSCPVRGCSTTINPRLPSLRRAQIQQHISEELAAGKGPELEAAGTILVQHRPNA